MLVHVVDCATFETERDPVSDIEALETELAHYAEALGTSALGSGSTSGRAWSRSTRSTSRTPPTWSTWSATT